MAFLSAYHKLRRIIGLGVCCIHIQCQLDSLGIRKEENSERLGGTEGTGREICSGP